MDIRRRIDELRAQRGWTRAEFARKIGISYTALRNWYNEKDFMPTLKTIDEICTLFNMTRSQLFYDADKDKTDEGLMVLSELYLNLSESRRKILVNVAKALTE